jgi:hypothetical protein
MEAEHTAPLYYCETHWFSLAEFLQRVFEMKEEKTNILSDINGARDDANLC